MRETTAQRNSRIANEDVGAHSAYAHSKDFYNGLATYEIEPKTNGFYVYVRTPHGQTCTTAKTIEEAEAIVADWKSSEVFAGYPKHFFIKD